MLEEILVWTTQTLYFYIKIGIFWTKRVGWGLETLRRQSIIILYYLVNTVSEFRRRDTLPLSSNIPINVKSLLFISNIYTVYQYMDNINVICSAAQ